MRYRNKLGSWKARQAKNRAAYLASQRAGYSTVPRTRGVYSKGEMKYYDTELTSTAIPASTDWTGTEFNPDTPNATSTLVAPAVGSAINQRIGRNVKLHKIIIRGQVNTAAQADQTATDAASRIRLLLVQDTQTNATQAQGEEIMQAPSTAAAALATSSFASLATLGRFRVLKDKMFVIDNPNITWDGTNLEQQGQVRNFKFSYKPRVPIKVSFNATNTAGGAIADIVDNSFCMYAICSNAGLAPNLTYKARAYYKE